MKIRTLYQTLEDRSNVPSIEKNGPGYCHDVKAWLCPGYYFWEASKDVARWWGNRTYYSARKGYVICKTTYDYAKDNLFDLVGDTEHKADFWDAVDVLSNEYDEQSMTVAMVLGFLREDDEFENHFDAVRAYPIRSRHLGKVIFFADNNVAYMEKDPPIQLCVWKNLQNVLTAPFVADETKKYNYRFRW